MLKQRLYSVIGMIALVTLSRLLPHPPNFTPVISVGLFAGAVVPGFGLSVLLVLVPMLISDFLLGFHETMLFVYGGILGATLIGRFLLDKLTLPRLLLGAFLASSGFFIISNVGVWLTSNQYAFTLQGLNECFVMALPFYKNELAATLVYGVVLHYGLKWSERFLTRLKPSV